MDEGITLGPLTFEYDAKRHEIHIAKGEEAAAMIEHVSPQDWDWFLEAAQ